MEKKHIVQILPMYHPDGEDVLNELANVTVFEKFNEQKIIDFLNNNVVDGIILRAPAKITPAILDACHHVKAISGAGVGLDNIDVTYATEKGIRILHAPQLNSQATAEHAVSLIMATMKNIVTFHQETKKGNFNYRDGQYTYELKGKTLGLVGFGTIARKVAHIMKNGFEMNVLTYVRTIDDNRRSLAKPLGVKLTKSINDVFKKSDVISLHIPLTDITKELINKTHFNLMKETAILINTARGGVINENDLYKALKNNKIMAAGLDVFAEEPPSKDHPFLTLDNIVLTPHIGGISFEASKATSVTIARNLIKAIDGEVVETIVNMNELAEKRLK